MTELFWRLLAWIVSRNAVACWLYFRAKRTPYRHLQRDGEPGIYMFRWWLFNPYDEDTRKARYPWVPFSVRVHHIIRHDRDQHLHDHPWNARTLIMAGGYVETRENGQLRLMKTGDTAALRFGEFHRIDSVASDVGALTLFITFGYQGTWGFKVNGQKVPWREYLAERQP